MEEDINKILKDNSKEYYRNALKAEENGDYNVALTLFFKALVSLSDLYIYLNENKIPSSHAERFRILEAKYPQIYSILDRDFPLYQDSYKLKLNKEACEVLRKDAEELFRLLNFKM